MNIATTEITIYTKSLSESFVGNPRAQQIYFASDAPNVAIETVTLRIPHRMLIEKLLAVWYQPIEGLEQLDGFSIIDVADTKESHFGSESLQVTLKASSIAGLSRQVKIRIQALYVGNIPRRV